MPPANSPALNILGQHSASSDDTTSNTPLRTLTPLSYLSSPVPNFAATLFAQAADDADEANASFLRDSLESLDQADGVMSSSLNQLTRQSQIDPRRDSRRVDPTSHPNRLINHEAPSRSASQRQHETLEELTRRERLQRVLTRLSRLNDSAATASTTSAYTNRTPSPNRQSLYDWAPSVEESDHQELSELDAILQELRRQQPDTHPGVLRVLSQDQLESHRQAMRESNDTPAPMDAFRAPELLVARDRDGRPRGESHSANWQALADRQRARLEAIRRVDRRQLEGTARRHDEEGNRSRGTDGPRTSNTSNERLGSTNPENWQLPPPARDTRDRDRRDRIDAFRREYLAENMPPRLPRISTPPVPSGTTQTTSPTRFLESALQYLSQLRESTCYEDALSTAMDHGLATKEFFADKHDDFMMDLEELPPLQTSSWLQPGAVFEGHQHAAHYAGVLTLSTPPAPSGPADRTVEQINPNFRNSMNLTQPSSARTDTPSDSSRPWLSNPPSIPPLKTIDPSQDHWPVRVVLHAVDPEKMIIQGTMEAYDVPQHPVGLGGGATFERPKAGKKNAPITTYVEGHIVDLACHSFLTPSTASRHKADQRPAPSRSTLTESVSFPAASAQTDAANWRKLPPFNQLSSSDAVARVLLSKAGLAEINERYIFMRWKERCFVHSRDDHCSEADRHGDQDRGHGLTISGFYYVSLRRDDGVIDGLYFDPSSTPYQHLRLKGRGVGWPAFELR